MEVEVDILDAQEVVECSRLSEQNRIAFAVCSCSGYSDRRQASRREMEDLAWVLRSNPRRNQIGFVPAGKLKPQDRYVLPDEWEWFRGKA